MPNHVIVRSPRMVNVNAHQLLTDLLQAALILRNSLAWEENRSGTTYHGYEQLKEAIASIEEELGQKLIP